MRIIEVSVSLKRVNEMYECVILSHAIICDVEETCTFTSMTFFFPVKNIASSPMAFGSGECHCFLCDDSFSLSKFVL